MRERRRRAHARGRGHPGRPVRLRARVRDREDAPRDHPVLVLRALARGSRARRDPRLLRTTRPAPHARVGRHEGPARRCRGEEPGPRCRQPERDVPQRGDGGAGARIAGRVRAAAPLDAVLTERGRGRRRAAGCSHRWRRVARHARGRRPALPSAGLGALRGDTAERARRRRCRAADDPGRPRRLRGSGRRTRRRRRRRVPGHGCRARVAFVRGARPLPQGRRREMDHGRCDPTRRPRARRTPAVGSCRRASHWARRRSGRSSSS